jgi:uncharacterized phage protein gp47/JayE
MLSNISDDIDKREGSVAYDMISPKALELAMAYVQLDNLLDIGFAETSYGEYLDKKVAEAGIIRNPAQTSTGNITVTGPVGTEIPTGTICYTDSGVSFTVTEGAIIGALGSVIVPVVSVEGGLDTVVPTNSIIYIEIDGVECTNTEPTVGGADEESDESLFERYSAKVKSPGVSGNANHYKQWALSVDGVGDAHVIPLANGNGTVKVIIINADKEPVSSDVLLAAQTFIEEQRPIGADVTVVSATNLYINISATLVISEGYLLEDIKAALETELTAYIKSIAFSTTESYVRYNQIGTIVLSVDGVTDYSDLLVNNGTENISIAVDQVPALGTVTLS